jgi:adenosylmethionine-8-amino-7-oxononanoate aminotransferase
VVLSKGLSNGTCAASVAVVGRRVIERFERADAVFAHGETQAGCPVSCAAIGGTLDFLEADLDLDHVGRLSEHLDVQLAELAAEHGLLHSGIGLFRALRRPAGTDPDPGFSARVIAAARAAGAVLHPCPDGVQLMPQLVTTESDLERIVAVLADALDETAHGPVATELAAASA